MKVIFLEDLPHVAQAGEIKDVADGYARNYLLPKKLASVVKPGIVNIIAARQAKLEAELKDMAGKVEGVEINIKAKAGSKDRLYGAVTAADIAAELSTATGLNIDKKRVELDKPIHQLGSYEIGIRLGQDVVPRIKVNVAQQEAAEPKASTVEAESAQPEVEVTAEDVAEEESAPPESPSGDK